MKCLDFLGPPYLLNLSRNLTIAFDTSPEATSIFDTVCVSVSLAEAENVYLHDLIFQDYKHIKE